MKQPQTVEQLFKLQRKLERRANFYYWLFCKFNFDFALHKCIQLRVQIREVEIEYTANVTLAKLYNE